MVIITLGDRDYYIGSLGPPKNNIDYYMICGCPWATCIIVVSIILRRVTICAAHPFFFFMNLNFIAEDTYNKVKACFLIHLQQ